MEKNRKKKAVDATRKGAKRLTEYKARETDTKASTTEAAFQRAFGKAKEPPRKGG